MDLAEATAALEGAMQQDAAAQSAPEQVAPPAATPEAGSSQPGTTEAPAAPAAEDSFTKLDPSTLPPEVQPYFKSMQADYTRGKQEIAEARRQFESLGDLETAQQALEFVSAFEADPLSVYERIQNYLTQEGLLEAQAAQAAAAARPDDAFVDDDGSDDPIVQELEQVKQWIAEKEAAESQMALQNHLHAQTISVRQAHPDWTDDDMADVLRLAFATGGDVQAAAEAYESIGQRLLSGYLQQKQAVQPPAPVPVSTTGSEVPTSLDSLETAHRAATEHLENLLANGGA